MKKTIALVMALLLLAALPVMPVRAASLIDLPAGESDHIRQNPEELRKSQNALERLLLGSDEADVVTIDEEEGVYTVQTVSGLTLEATIPFGSVCVTQGILQQLNLYSSLYSNINSAYEYYISKGIRMDIYNMLTYQDIYVAVTEESLAKLVGSLTDLSEEDQGYILSFASSNWYKGTEGTLTQINDRTFMVFDLREAAGYYLYETFAAGQDICIYSFIDEGDEDWVAELAEQMENLVITENA